ncbi:unnamed protein product [Parajaminaea phylloscopi]
MFTQISTPILGLLAAVVLAVAPGTHATPLRRNDVAGCQTYASATLDIVYPGGSYKRSNVGILPNVKKADVGGAQASILVSKTVNGSALSPQQWEFARCPDITEHAGRKVGQDSNFYYTFGIVRPKGATQHCLAYSTSDTSAGQRSIVDSVCANIPQKFRTWTLVEDLSGRDPVKYALQLDNTNIVVGNTKHGELQFYDGPVPAGATTVELEL